MTITTQRPAATAGPAPGTCRYPGCGHPVRTREKDAPGRRPGYCEREVPEDRDGAAVLVRHTALSAFRRRAGAATGQPGADRPVTAALGRAGAIRDDALAAMSRLSVGLTAALDQLAVLADQLAAAGDPEAAEAQAEAVRAEAAARLEQARAEAAGHAAARHTADTDAAEARAAAMEALTALDTQTTARGQAEHAADTAAAVLADERAVHAAALAAAHAQRDTALAAAEHARRDAEHDRGRHDAALTALEGTVTALREQLARAQAALDRERAEQHKTVALLHDLLTARPDPKPTRRQPADH
jgi:colicin import membrane protein